MTINLKKIILLALCLTSMTLIIVANASASPVVGFEAGRIIDDLVFTNKYSMNISQIQEFLNSKVPICDTWATNGSTVTSRLIYIRNAGYDIPLTCLKEYQENGKSSAQIIYDASFEYDINPQVLLVLLQKEQALVTDDWPVSGQYKSATGYGCPDDAPCDAEYYGFTNQVRWAARMFRAILNDSPTWYTPYETGNNYVQYSPDSGCDGSTINIQNRSTQALYNYTPYQPNSASLNAGYGSGDYCSTYGNRNFYLYFKDWFGPTHRKLVTDDFQNIYLVEDGLKRFFPSAQVFSSYSYKWADIIQISKTELQNIPNGQNIEYNAHYLDYKLVTADLNSIYLVENGTKRIFPSAEVFSSYLYKWADILKISDVEVSLIPNGAAMSYNAHFRDGQLITSNFNNIYLVENGLKRLFISGQAFSSYSYKWASIITTSDIEVALIANGTAISYNAASRNGQLIKTQTSNGAYLVENGTKRAFPSGLIFSSYSYKWADILTISDEEIVLIPDGAAMLYSAHFRDGQLIKTQDSSGVYLVENSTKRPFPSGLIFSSYLYKWEDILTISDEEIALIPDGAAMFYNAHFRDGQLITSDFNNIYLVENGLKRLFTSGQAFSSYSYKWADILIINDEEIALIPDGETVVYGATSRNGQLVKTQDSSSVYLVENGTKRVFPSGLIFSSYSYKWADIVTISDAEITLIPDGIAMTAKQ